MLILYTLLITPEKAKPARNFCGGEVIPSHDSFLCFVSRFSSLCLWPRQLLLCRQRLAGVLRPRNRRVRSRGPRTWESDRIRCREGDVARLEGNVWMQRRDPVDSA